MLNRTLLIAGAGVMIASAQAQEGVLVGGAPVVATQGVEAVRTIGPSEFGPGAQVVKNAPYQAEAVTETIQVLADGNRIVRRNTATMARDSEGRTRRDLNVAGAASRFTVIHDPVANVSYTLDHESKTVRKMPGNGVVIHMESRGPAGRAETRQMNADVIALNPPGIAAAGGVAMMRRPPELLLEGGPTAFNVRVRKNDNAKTESLGKQTVEGLLAEGTRTTNVIPAGEIGNERPIEIVFERWYSPELQLLMSSKHKDPMMGETTYKLTNLRRAEPLKSLFEVPADYTVKEAPAAPDVRVFPRRPEKE